MLVTDLDEKWFHSLCRGEREAWQDLLDSELGRRIVRRCRATEAELKARKFLRQETWEDVLQECLLAIHEAAMKLQESGAPAPVPGFFWVVADRACVGVRRRAQGSAQGLYQATDVKDEAGEAKSAIVVHDVDRNAGAEFDEADFRDWIDRAGIKPEGKQVLMLWLEGYPLTQIAKRLHLPESTVRSRFLAAMRKFREDGEGE